MNQLAPASESQKKLFFALCTELGYDQEVLKERAKELYSLASFADISSLQISALIDKLQHEKHFPSKPEQKPNTEVSWISYRFGVFVTASSFMPIAKIFKEINDGMSEIMGQDVQIDADVQVGTITCNSKNKLTSVQLNQMASIIQTDFQERLKIAKVIIKPL